MAPKLTTIDASEPLDKILAIIARDGGVVVSNFLAPELLNELMRAVEKFFSGGEMYDSRSTHREFGEDFFPQGSQRIYDDVNYGTGNLFDPKNPLFTPMVGCLIAGSRTTYKNGATAVIPRSHLWGPERAPKVEECTYAEMDPGSALFTLGNKAVGGVGFVGDHKDPAELLQMDANAVGNGMGKFVE
ncbi:putative phytanoyl- dioxygenase family protein [Phaeoacremonium minimum UCRPA7]|uniref:Putative phytanoyl-dioxygenase family protein n=1 Tax=Phaeoacremonium minimum (strain UCR-PA7) TaxID=1286976 RepID=R8BMT2_PHAM7|nr:putative phytanoyl- dioxygenase family protein [Phaeoacremonium minimum UCRPA7]EOO00580.1 putative phytanoyl- dioxygenase family protein [Phaeoacremonium minimum UCRPA7]